MNLKNSILLPARKGEAETGRHTSRDFMTCCFVVLAVLGAALATAASLGIAAYAGWQRGGLPVERTMNVTLSCVAVLFVHLLPVGWRLCGTIARVCMSALWLIGVAVVLYGQVTFLVVSQLHAGNNRAASVPVILALPTTNRPPGRTRTEIAQDIAKVTAELARVEISRCEGGCPGLVVRRAMLSARLSALNVESDEAMRREAEYDRRMVQSDRDEAQRAALRTDPVASQVAPWLGTTEGSLELLVAFACAVVLEGAACLCWCLAAMSLAPVSGRSVSRVSRADVSHAVEVSQADESGIVSADHDGVASTESIGGDVVELSDDEREIGRIHAAVRAGHLSPTQKSIREYLGCGQQKAGRINRLYAEQLDRVATEAV